MPQTSVNIRMDSELKNQFENFCNDVGMNMTTAFNIFAKTAVREQRIPFEISAKKNDPFYSSENIARLKKNMAQVEAGKAHFTEHDLIEV